MIGTEVKSSVKNELRRKIAALLLAKRKVSEAKIFRIECDINPIDLLDWLDCQPFSAKNFWSEQDGSFAAAGVGSAWAYSVPFSSDRSQVLDHVQAVLRTQPAARVYGGFSFADSPSSSEWEFLRGGYFVLPRFELLREGERYKLACNLVVSQGTALSVVYSQVLQDLEFLEMGLPLPKPVVNYYRRIDYPSKQDWCLILSTTIDVLRQSRLKKVVLARKTVFEFPRLVSPLRLLSEICKHDKLAYHFCIQKNAEVAFVGGTPESLYFREDNRIKTEALAGTALRGRTPEEDQTLEQGLLRQMKERREHQLVGEDIREKLAMLCQSVQTDETISVRKLAVIQHLLSRFRGVLRKGVTDGKILSTLHPTPAVAGTPTDLAMKVIAQCEPNGRGWYAGPIGWIRANSARFVVAIRSGTVSREKVTLYSGAGITVDSDPIAEWDEVESKIALFTRLFSKS